MRQHTHLLQQGAWIHLIPVLFFEQSPRFHKVDIIHKNTTYIRCSVGCSTGCGVGCSVGCSTGCGVGCSVGCSVGCDMHSKSNQFIEKGQKDKMLV